MWVHATTHASGAAGFAGMSRVTLALRITREGEVDGGLANDIAL